MVLKLGGGYGWLLCLVGLLLSFLFIVYVYDPEIECVIIEWWFVLVMIAGVNYQWNSCDEGEQASKHCELCG